MAYLERLPQEQTQELFPDCGGALWFIGCLRPVSSKTASTNNKKIAMELLACTRILLLKPAGNRRSWPCLDHVLRFVHASKDVQAQMLKDPTVARVTASAALRQQGSHLHTGLSEAVLV